MTILPGDLSSFAERLRYLVKASALTQQRFAEECDISQAALEKYLRGGTPSADAAIKICEARSVSADWLLLGRAPQPPISRGFVKHLLTKNGEKILSDFIDDAISKDDPNGYLAEARWLVIDIAMRRTDYGMELFDQHWSALAVTGRVMPAHLKVFDQDDV